MTTTTAAATSQDSDFSHAAPSRGPPSRSYSTRSSRPPPASSAAAAARPTLSSATTSQPQQQQQQYSHHHHLQQQQQQQQQPLHHNHYSHQGYHQGLSQPQKQQQQQQDRHHSRRSSSTIRTVQDQVSQNDYDSSNLTTAYNKRSSSRDRPPPSNASRATDASRPHRRSNSNRSTTSSSRQAHPEMPASTVANNGHGHGNGNGNGNGHTATAAATATATASTHHGTAAPSHAIGDAPHGAATASMKQARSRTTIPTSSGKWILGKTVGAGSMGKVKLARKEDGTEQVACKIIPRGSSDDGHQTRAEKERADQSKEIRTAREAAIVSLLHHPHICGLRDVVRTNHHWYMLFEYVNGGQMLDYIISHGKLKEKQARKFSRQIASALDYCHRNSIVHRDLKIENILISKTGDIKIIDFGLSNLFSPRGHLKTFCGSLYFAAPELLQARAYTGPEVDVWSFGIVLYVLVCGKVPFDDQSMPALHAKIKKGLVDYPSWLSTECKHLLSRMLVTEPKQRATMQEVMNHPWMIKGFNGPPENYLPVRGPLNPRLEPEVLQAMQGFNFGSPDAIKAQLTKVIESEDYQQAVKAYQRERELPQPTKDTEKRRGFGFDFYKRRNSSNSHDTLTGPSSEGLALGADPLNAFSPLTSVYYLVKEKQEREQSEVTPPPTSASARDRDKAREREKTAAEPLPDIAPPQEAHTNPGAFEIPGEGAVGAGRTRPRARTHGEDDAPDGVKQAQPVQAETKVEQLQKKEGGAAGLLRRFSTRKRRESERPEKEKDRSHPPMVQVHSPIEAPTPTPTAPRKSFSMRRGRRDRDEHSRMTLPAGAGNQTQHPELLSPPVTGGGGGGGAPRVSRKSGLGRSTSVNSADLRRRDVARAPPLTSCSDQSMINDQPAAGTRGHGHGHGHSQSVTTRAKSLGHARRESVQQRRLRRDAGTQEANVPEETDMEQEQSGVSTDKLDSSELAKPVFLKGLFSVSTTSGKSVPLIRTDIRRVLKQLNVDYVEIKGGFSCKHSPSIDLKKVSEQPPGSPNGGHGRPFTFGGLIRGEDRDRDDAREHERPTTTPRTPGRSERERHREQNYSNSDSSVDSIPRRNGGGAGGGGGSSSKRAPGETSTQVQSDLGGNMVLEFEIFIVKVPLLSLHGIQFKRMTGNTWQFKNMAEQILKELRL